MVLKTALTSCPSCATDLTAILELADGPKKPAALVAWIQGRYPEGLEPVLVGGAAVERARLVERAEALGADAALRALLAFSRRLGRAHPSTEEIERWANRGP